MSFEKFYLDKGAVITGAASGIGRTLAQQLAPMVKTLILVDKDESGLDSLIAELNEYELDCHKLTADLTDSEAIKHLSDKIINSLPHPDILINCAGFGRVGDFDSMDLKVCTDMIQLNVTATTILTRKLIPGMLQKKSGAILNVASTAAFQPLAKFSVYSGTKSFILNFTESLWGEYAHRGIKVSVLCPGNTKTKFHETAQIGSKHIFNLMDPEQVARKGLEGLAKGRMTIIPHLGDQILTFFGRFAPRQIMAMCTRKFYT